MYGYTKPQNYQYILIFPNTNICMNIAKLGLLILILLSAEWFEQKEAWEKVCVNVLLSLFKSAHHSRVIQGKKARYINMPSLCSFLPWATPPWWDGWGSEGRQHQDYSSPTPCFNSSCSGRVCVCEPEASPLNQSTGGQTPTLTNLHKRKTFQPSLLILPIPEWGSKREYWNGFQKVWWFVPRRSCKVCNFIGICKKWPDALMLPELKF